jgi:glycosyltransferase involved in cell wall biosynthesis
MRNASSVCFVVCCFNSAARLPETLARIANQAGASACIVVDNASTDGTASTAHAVWKAHGAPFPLMVVAEPTPGLVHARARGLAAAGSVQARIACFVDDDNRLEGQWVDRLGTLMDEQPGVAAIGGLGQPIFTDGPEPAWFAAVQGSFACGPQASAGLVPAEHGILYGAGLALRMDAWRAIQPSYRPRLCGRLGERMLAGDDAELTMTLQLAGWRLWYEPSLRFGHLMPARRVQPAVVESMFFGFGQSSRVIGELHRRMLGRSAGLYAHPRLYRMVARARCWRHGWFGSPVPDPRGQIPRTAMFFSAGCCEAV